MKKESVDMNRPHERLVSYLDSVPFPWVEGTDIDRAAKRLVKDSEALSLVGPEIAVQVLSTFLTDYLINHLVLMFARRGMRANIRCDEYGVLATAILDESHDIHTSPPDLFLILLSHRDLRFCPSLNADPETGKKAIVEEAAFWASLLSRLPAPAVQLSFDTPRLRPLGELDGFIPGGVTYHARGVNRELATNLPAFSTLVDAESLAQTVGLHNWHDPHVYNLCKQPFSFTALPHVADALSAAAIGLLGKARKVLVLDLDNTLWGGVVGDDGLEHIELGPETPEGEPFTTFQRYLLGLKRRGIVLAVCSKNHDEIARQPFRKHRAMILHETDIACFAANFDDKPTNLVQIAESLNVGVDALVFVDDNPVERALVRQELPEVLTIELPDNPALFATALDAARVFPLSRLTEDDMRRTDSYVSRAVTARAMESVSDMDGFLAGLEAQAIIEPVGPDNIDRIAQLLAKTNQFKLNPKVFSTSELTERKDDVIALRLVDSLQDYGIVAVAVLNPVLELDNTLVIENWVMSCRVFSRRLEYVMHDLVSERAAQARVGSIRLRYVASGRNSLVSNLLLTLGFCEVKNNDIWEAQTFLPNTAGDATRHLPAHHMTVVRSSD